MTVQEIINRYEATVGMYRDRLREGMTKEEYVAMAGKEWQRIKPDLEAAIAKEKNGEEPYDD